MVLKRAVSIWLKADLDLLVKRTNFRRTRPQLLNNDSRVILSQLINERYDTYAMANIMVETHDESLRKTLDAVLKTLEQYQKTTKKDE
jgi:shikimate kinase